MKTFISLLILTTLIFASLASALEVLEVQQIGSSSLEAGEIISFVDGFEGECFVTYDDGTTEVMPCDVADEMVASLISLEFWNRGTCNTNSDCEPIAQDFCDDKAYDVGRALCLQRSKTCQIGCTVPTTCEISRCRRALDCRYGYEDEPECRGNTCYKGDCSSPVDCTEALAREDCQDQADDKGMALEDYGCSGGTIVCDFMPKSTVQCTRTSDCAAPSQAKCGSATQVDQSYCNVVKDCFGEIASSTCIISCKTQKYCGDGRCELAETCSNCPTDCGKCATDAKCSSTLNQCLKGSFQDLRDTSTTYKWECQASGSGRDATCTLDKNTRTPINPNEYETKIAPQGHFCGIGCVRNTCYNYVCDSGLSCVNKYCRESEPITPLPPTPGLNCGDGRCDSGENYENCPFDCASPRQACEPYTSDYYCIGSDLVYNVTYSSCEEQILTEKHCEVGCENGTCIYTGPSGYCGDGTCDVVYESPFDCSEDCDDPSFVYCGDGVCNEPTSSCPNDCQQPPDAPPPWGGGITEEQIVIIGAVVMLILGGGALYYFMRRK
jgi:hypothetical protein